MEVFVTGGTGYIGRPIIEALLREGHRVRVLEREGTRRPLDLPMLRRVPGDLRNRSALEAGVDGAEAVIHLVGILRETPGQTFHRVHVEGTAAVLQAAERAGVRRFLHMSALGATRAGNTAYFRTKGEAEDLVRASRLAWTIFRPSLVFGPGGPGPQFLSDLRDRLLSLPLHPLFGGGDQQLQPVAVATVASAFSKALVRPETEGRVYDLAGPHVVTMRQVLERLAQHLHRPFRPISLPVPLLLAILGTAGHLPGFPLTKDQLLMLLQGSVSEHWGTLYRDLDLVPIPFSVQHLPPHAPKG